MKSMRQLQLSGYEGPKVIEIEVRNSYCIMCSLKETVMTNKRKA